MITPAPPLATPHLGALLRVLGRKLQASVETRFDAADINYTQWRALCSIEGTASVDGKTLAATLAVSPSTVSRVVDGLEVRGLVCRQRSIAGCPELTPAGMAKLREVAPVVDQRLAAALAGLSDCEIDTLMALLDRLATCIDGLAARPKEA